MLLRILLAGWIGTLACRVLVFGDGGTLGAYVVVGLFWLSTLALVGLAALRLATRRTKHQLEYALGLGALLAFVFRVFVTDGPAASLSALLFVACLIALAVVCIRDVWMRGRQGPASTTVSG